MFRPPFLLLILIAGPVFANEFEITKPDVRHPRVVRSDVTFQPGDEVIVHAGGCVNVGGGDWRDYLAPSGKKSDRLYHGRINIPGATAGVVRIGTVIDRPLQVTMVPPHRTGPLTLEIGYDAEDYSRVSYDGSMSGGCSAPAWIRIERRPHAATGEPVASPVPTAPLDLSWHAVDDNYRRVIHGEFSSHEVTGHMRRTCGEDATWWEHFRCADSSAPAAHISSTASARRSSVC